MQYLVGLRYSHNYCLPQETLREREKEDEAAAAAQAIATEDPLYYPQVAKVSNEKLGQFYQPKSFIRVSKRILTFRCLNRAIRRLLFRVVQRRSRGGGRDSVGRGDYGKITSMVKSVTKNLKSLYVGVILHFV